MELRKLSSIPVSDLNNLYFDKLSPERRKEILHAFCFASFKEIKECFDQLTAPIYRHQVGHVLSFLTEETEGRFCIKDNYLLCDNQIVGVVIIADSDFIVNKVVHF